MITKHINAEYDAVAPNGIPHGVGDRHYLQDYARDWYYLMDRLGLTIGETTDQLKFLLYGGVVTQEMPVGDKQIAISAGVGYVKKSVQTRLSTAIPPTTQNEDVEYIRINWTAQTNVDASAATYDGATPNYVKIAYTELNGSSRARAKAAGNWNYDQAPSFTITINAVAPTAYELCLTSFIAPAGGTMTFDDVAAAGPRTPILHCRYYEKENLLVNGEFRFAQAGASGAAVFTAATLPANSDDTYLLDQWILLSDGNDIVDVSQNAAIPGTRGMSMKSLVATINKKWGFLQIIEHEVANELQGKKVSLSFWAKTTAAAVIANIRAAVLSWNGAADTVTSDIVNAWNAADADITPVANWTIENTPANLPLSTQWRQYTIENISIDTAGTNNLGVFIWVNDTDAALNDELFLAEVSLNIGEKVCPVKYKKFKDDLEDCKKFYLKSYNLDTVPGTAVAVGERWFEYVDGDNAAYTLYFHIDFPVIMRTTPTVIAYDLAGTINSVSMDSGPQAAAISNPGQTGVTIGGTNAGATVTKQLKFHFTADARL